MARNVVELERLKKPALHVGCIFVSTENVSYGRIGIGLKKLLTSGYFVIFHFRPTESETEIKNVKHAVNGFQIGSRHSGRCILSASSSHWKTRRLNRIRMQILHL